MKKLLVIFTCVFFLSGCNLPHDQSEEKVVFEKPNIPEGVKNCGTENRDNRPLPDSYNDDMRSCFAKAFESCERATVSSNIVTIEGDPIFTQATTEKQENGCKIKVFVDSKDKFGKQGQFNHVCDTVNLLQFEGKDHLEFTQCDNTDLVTI